MKPVSAFDNYPPFATNGARTMNTESAKYSVGFVPADTFPAEWANYLFHGATKGVSDLNTAVTSVQTEVQNVITSSGQTPSADDNTQLQSAIMKFVNDAVLAANQQILNQAKLDAHPVGSLYWSSDPTNPAELFGGTWTQIKDRFVWAKGDSDTVNATGGEKTHTLTVAEMPSHNHSASSNTVKKTGQVKFAADGTMMFSPSGVFSLEHSITFHIPSVTGSTQSGYNFLNFSSSHSHTITVNNTGSNSAHNNMPPFIVKYCWERTA